MKHIELVEKLEKRIKYRRIIEAILNGISLFLIILFSVLKEKTKVVEIIGWGPFKYESVEYTPIYDTLLLIFALIFAMAISFLTVDLLFSKVQSVEVYGNHITVYRGFLHVNLYVNGELKDSLTPFCHYLEAELADRVKVTATFGKWSTHLTFSNGYPSIDL